MNRRKFLKGLGLGIGVALVAPTIITNPKIGSVEVKEVEVFSDWKETDFKLVGVTVEEKTRALQATISEELYNDIAKQSGLNVGHVKNTVPINFNDPDLTRDITPKWLHS